MGLFGKKKQRAGDGSPMSDSDLEVLAANGDEAATNTLAATREGFSEIASAWANAANVGEYAVQFRFGLLEQLDRAIRDHDAEAMFEHAKKKAKKLVNSFNSSVPTNKKRTELQSRGVYQP